MNQYQGYATENSVLNSIRISKTGFLTYCFSIDGLMSSDVILATSFFEAHEIAVALVRARILLTYPLNGS